MADYVTYSASISATANSTAVTGSGTAFVTDGVRSGDIAYFIEGTGPVGYVIASVESATGLTLATEYEGSTAGSKTVVVTRRYGEEAAADTYRLLNSYVQSLETSASIGQAGILYAYSNTTSMADPGPGLFRLNNASAASATAIAIADECGETGNPDASAFINAFDDSTSSIKGYLYIKKAGSPQTFMVYAITALSDNSGWSQLTVTYVTGNGSLTNADDVRFEFYRTGNDGFENGLKFTYSTTTTDADPGAGIFRFNNATFASITNIFVDNVDFNGVTVTTLLDSWDDSSNTAHRGTLRFQKVGDPTVFREFTITGAITDGTGYRKIPVTPSVSNGTWTNGNNFVLLFTRTGDNGTDGYDPGFRFLFSTTTTDSDPGAGYVRFDNANAALATFAYMDNADYAAADVTAWLDSLDDSTDGNVKGYLRIQKVGDPAIYREFAVTGSVTNGTGYRKIPVDLIAEAGSFSDAMEIVCSFSRTGNAGTNGYEAGFLYNFSTTTTDSDPASGNLRFNNALFGSITFIYIDDEDAGANDLSAWIATLDGSDSVVKGHLHIQKAGDPATYRHFQISNTLTDGGTYYKIPVTALVSNGTLADGDDIVITFSRTGDAGDGNGDFLADGSVPMTAALDFDGNGAINLESINSGPIAGFRNHIINGAMMVAQAGTSFTSATTPANGDDTYLLDQWILLADGADTVDVTQSTDAPTNGLNSIALDVETVNKKFGIFQPIEQKNCIGLIGNTVTLSFYARVSDVSKLDNVKAAIVSWSGTADTITSDIVSAWGAEDTNPTLAANWTYENTPVNLGVTTSWVRYSITAAIDTASTKNIGVFIWSDVTDTTLAHFLYITDVQLEVGSVATPFERRPFQTEYYLCKRYFWIPGTLVGTSSTTTVVTAFMEYNPPMRTSPTVALLNGTSNCVDIGVGSRTISGAVTYTGDGDGGRANIAIATTTANKVHHFQEGCFSIDARL